MDEEKNVLITDENERLRTDQVQVDEQAMKQY